MGLSLELREKVLQFQKDEITEYHVYRRLAKKIPNPENRSILERIAEDELRHYREWREYSQKEVKANRLRISLYYWISRIFGFTFGVKLMEQGEVSAQAGYREVADAIPDARRILDEEARHEVELLEMLDEERLRYTGSMVLGLNDALVELTGALAGLTLALQDTRLIALTGSITGIAAALSMGASEYLSTRSEQTAKNPLKASLYTGIAYLFTVLVLILPYLVVADYYLCLGITLGLAVLVIAGFNYYISVARDEPFRRRFYEMAAVSLGVAGFSFLIGLLLRNVLGVEV